MNSETQFKEVRHRNGKVRFQLVHESRNDRNIEILNLKTQGLSAAAISGVVGVPKETVWRVLRIHRKP